VTWESAHQWFVNTRPFRRVVDAVLRRRARRRLVAFDHADVGRCQARILRGLVHRAQATPFGREHDFRRIRTPDDFRRLVPLQRANDPLRNGLHLDSWMTGALASAHYQAAVTALGFVGAARPHARPLLGGLLFLHEAERVSQTVFAKLPVLRVLRPAYSSPPTVAVGSLADLADWFATARHRTGSEDIAKPGLAAVIYSLGPIDPDRPTLLDDMAASPGPLFLEACWRAEGAIAVEDPRHGLLRLLTDHGIYFEFVPVEEWNEEQPTRHSAAEIEPGVVYGVALTSAADVWALRTDLTVRFERRDPPLLQRLNVELPSVAPTDPARPRQLLIPSPPHPFMTQPPHPRNGDSLAVHPGTTGRSPSSTRVGRE
jgi:hypothetical protein